MMRNVGKKVIMPYANSEGPDEPAQPCSLIRTFFIRCHIVHSPFITKTCLHNFDPLNPTFIYM